MGRDLQGNNLGRNYSQHPSGNYKYCLSKNGRTIGIYDRDLDRLRKLVNDPVFIQKKFAEYDATHVNLKIDDNDKKHNILYVYFISEGLNVKIGRTNDVKHRLDQLQIGSPNKLEVIRIIATNQAAYLEGVLHALFKSVRIHGEWYLFTQEMIDAIKDDTVMRDFED